MGALHRYLVEEVGEDYSDGLISRREALKRLGLLGLGAAAATSLLAACARDEAAAPQASPSPTQAPTPTAVPTEEITFQGRDDETVYAAWAPAAEARGGVLVIHENRGLNDHIRNVAGRFAAVGYSALAVDLLSPEGGTASLGGDAEAMAALDRVSDEQFVTTMRSGIDELERRVPEQNLGAVGFCFGGAMVWMLVDSPETRLAAAVPFYGTIPEDPDFSQSNAAVLAIYAGEDTRVNATRADAEAALEEAGLTYRVTTFEGADHAFFNDTGMRYNAEAAMDAWQRVQDWFATHLA